MSPQSLLPFAFCALVVVGCGAECIVDCTDRHEVVVTDEAGQRLSSFEATLQLEGQPPIAFGCAQGAPTRDDTWPVACVSDGFMVQQKSASVSVTVSAGALRYEGPLAPRWRPNESECINACDNARETLVLR